jgi:hypothetical protein
LLILSDEIVDVCTRMLDDDEFETEIKKKGEFVCKLIARTSKLSREKACHKACKILGYL